MTGTPDDPVAVRRDGDVLVVELDDGKANAISFAVLEALEGVLADVGDARALALVGRPGKFSAGFDLSVIQGQPERQMELMDRGGWMALSLWNLPIPIVFGVTGHALAMGAVMLFCADYRVGARGPFKIGLNEVRIGLAVPPFATELARARLDPRHHNRATLLAEVYDPDGALAAGFVDEVVEPDDVATRTLELARAFAEDLRPGAFKTTRRIVRGELGARLAESLGG